MPQLYHFIAEPFKENLMLGGNGQAQHMVAGRLCQYLKPWQLEGLRFLYKNYEKSEGCILNDESGLGKVVTVTTFLGSILTNDTTKKCLIVVRDEAAIEEWQFHLGVLTHLTVKVIERTSDINFETVFIIKWSCLKDMSDIDKVAFDHVIIDNRGEMLNNKFCTGILLRFFENKTTIIVSSADVTSDIRLLHILLRLCGRLDSQFTDAKVFENKFQLPQLKEGVSNKVDLEDYFVKRERVINFCREFRLRRYCHQYDDEFPIVSRSIFQRHLEQWKNEQRNSLSSGSVKLMSSSSEKDTEELFKEYFQVKKERDPSRLDHEVEQINDNLPSVNHFDEGDDSSDDVVVMSPLILDSESESDDDLTQMQNERNSQFIEEVQDDVNKGKKQREEEKTNRRKSKTPVKTAPNSNKNVLLNDSKSLRFRTFTSPKIPLPLRTNSRKSRKSVETDKAKQNKDNEKAKRPRSQEKVKKSDETARKSLPKNDDSTEKSEDTPKRSSAKKQEEDKRQSSKDETPKKPKPISEDKKPENSSKQKDNSSESIRETQPIIKTARVKLREFCSKKNNKQDKPKALDLKKENKMTKDIDPKENDEEKDNLKFVIPKPSKKSFAIMLEEAKKFVTNENIGRTTRNPSEKTKSRSKAPKPPELVIESESNSNKTKKTPPESVQQPATDKSPANSKPNKKIKLTELAPVGVHSISTRGMQRHTRSNPATTTSKYMKVTIAQVGVAKQKTPKAKKDHRPPVTTKTLSAQKKRPPTPPKSSSKRPPSPTPSAISASPAESIQLGQALTPTNTFAVPEVIPPPAPRSSNYHFPLTLDKDNSDSECQITPETSNNQEVIILTGSSTSEREMEPPKSTVSRRKAIAARPPMVTIPRPMFVKAKSPDLFSTCSDVSLPCSQNTNKSHFEGFKIFGSELRQPVKQQQRSCLDILERMLEPRSGIVAGKKSTTATQEKPPPKPTSHRQHCLDDEDAMFEITANCTFGNTLRVNSNGELSPIKNQSTPPSSTAKPKNRITNYLINNSQYTSVLGQQLPATLDDDLLPKTPKRRKSLSGGSAKRSPRSLSGGACIAGGKSSQSTKLTQWLVKNASNSHANDSSPVKQPPTKRRRLDLSFPDN